MRLGLFCTAAIFNRLLGCGDSDAEINLNSSALSIIQATKLQRFLQQAESKPVGVGSDFGVAADNFYTCSRSL